MSSSTLRDQHALGPLVVGTQAVLRTGQSRPADHAGATAEVFYDTRLGAWSRQTYQAGVEIEIAKHWRVEPYYARQEDQRSSPRHLDRAGLVLKTYW